MKEKIKIKKVSQAFGIVSRSIQSLIMMLRRNKVRFDFFLPILVKERSNCNEKYSTLTFRLFKFSKFYNSICVLLKGLIPFPNIGYKLFCFNAALRVKSKRSTLRVLFHSQSLSNYYNSWAFRKLANDCLLTKI